MDTIISQESKVKSQKSEEQILAENGFFWREKNGVKVLVSRNLEEKGFVNGFSTRLGGVSPFPENDLNLAGFDEDSAENIFENRRRFVYVFGEKYQLSTVWQVHSDLIKVVRNQRDAENTEERFDALTSDLENLLIGVKTADCVPVLIGDTSTGAFAAIHAGWRGTVESIVIKAVEKMKENFGTRPEDLICAVGPAATVKNYEIGQDVIDAFAEKFPHSNHLFQKTREGHARIDLHLANQEQLLSVGVFRENIDVAPFCTMERTDLFFSYRVEKRKFGKTGRLLSVIGRNADYSNL
jgi:YfiH family protein